MCDVGTVTVPLIHNESIKQQPANFLDLERAYSDFATDFITTYAKKGQPFFLYFPSHVSDRKKVCFFLAEIPTIKLLSATYSHK